MPDQAGQEMHEFEKAEYEKRRLKLLKERRKDWLRDVKDNRRDARAPSERL